MPVRPTIVLVVSNKETNAQIRSVKPSMLEIRADLLPTLESKGLVGQIKIRRSLNIPILLTVRNQKEEGAVKVFNDHQKWALIEAGLPLVDLIDIELSSPLLKQVVALAHRLKKKVVVSSHDFKAMPMKDRLGKILKLSKTSGADFIKIAAMAKTTDDVWRLIDFTRANGHEPLITMAMGEKGKIARLLLPLAGSPWVYTFLGTPKAPGQIDVKTLNTHLKFYYP